MTVVIIVGMHRSGTSCLAGTLQQQGLYLGKVFESNPYNQKGNRENAEIMGLNDQILAHNGNSWNNPPAAITWTNDHVLIRDQIIRTFRESGHPTWGFKDPRTLFTLDFWQEGLQKIDIKFIGSFRHPLSVANSMWNRDKMAIQDGLLLWGKYNSRLLGIQRKYDFPLISFDVSSEEYQESINRILSDLEIAPALQPEEIFFDDSLRHGAIDHSMAIPRAIMEIYDELTQKYKDQVL